ncbi:MAG: DNA repair exonuclease [Candidatus Micrarchaeia archaeon]|jgi:DNA repair exonuclease SbcCD nuclease subunit
MKIGIISDFHLGYERFYEDAYIQAKEALEKASSLADMLILPGDLFDSRSPKPEVLAQAMTLFRDLAGKKWEAKIASYEGPRKIYTSLPILAIPGTHERRSENAENAVELLNLAGLLVNVSESRAVVEKDGEKVAVYGIGGISEERFRDFLKEKNPKPVDSLFNVFVFHQSIYDLMPFDKNFIYLDELPPGFDLYIDGHIHSRVERSVHAKPFLIPGSTVLTQLKEEEVARKGFFLFDTKTKKYEFVEINSRKFFVIKVDITGKAPSEALEEAENKINFIVAKEEKPIIKLTLVGKAGRGFQQSDFGLLVLAKKFEGKAIVEVSKDIEDEEVEGEIEALRSREIENVSIKEFGMSIFLQELGAKGYNLKLSPVELFDLLSSDKNKEKVISKALSSLFKEN